MKCQQREVSTQMQKWNDIHKCSNDPEPPLGTRECPTKLSYKATTVQCALQHATGKLIPLKKASTGYKQWCFEKVWHMKPEFSKYMPLDLFLQKLFSWECSPQLTTTGCLKYSSVALFLRHERSTPWNCCWCLQQKHYTILIKWRVTTPQMTRAYHWTQVHVCVKKDCLILQWLTKREFCCAALRTGPHHWKANNKECPQ